MHQPQRGPHGGCGSGGARAHHSGDLCAEFRVRLFGHRRVHGVVITRRRLAPQLHDLVHEQQGGGKPVPRLRAVARDLFAQGADRMGVPVPQGPHAGAPVEPLGSARGGMGGAGLHLRSEDARAEVQQGVDSCRELIHAGQRAAPMLRPGCEM